MINLFVTWDLDPVFFSIFGFEIRYYSLMWMIAFIFCALIMSKMMKREWGDDKLLDSAFMYSLLGTIIGARLGHCLFYDPAFYFTHPIQILNLRAGGLASHGGTLGLIIGAWLFARKNKLPFFWPLDRIAIVAPMAGGIIRIGNLFNSEIFGTATDLSWGFKFLRSREWQVNFAPDACHPTQIYEALIYFVIFAFVCYLYFGKDLARKKPGAISGLSIALIFIGRFFIETIKNVQGPFEEGLTLNMGQILSIPLVLIFTVIFIMGMRGYFIPKKNK
ncbi:MAG: prolipoprotein diacylglyceryl transferase [Bacteroidetes bacterium]|nr:prolipoprotein diacylglyceryl transferase [Bacteroidota bacterium]